MASSGHLVSPKHEPSKEKLWTETWKRVDRFLPDLRSELALDEDEDEDEDEEEVEKPGDVQEDAVSEPAAIPADEGKPEEEKMEQSELKA